MMITNNYLWYIIYNFVKMSLNWTRDGTQNKGVFGEVGFEQAPTYVVSVPTTSGSGTVVSLNSNKVGLLLQTSNVPSGVQRNNGNLGTELYLVNYVFEAIPDTAGVATFTVDGGGSTYYLAGEKITTVASQQIIISGSIVVQSPNDGDVFTIRSLHSVGCDYDVQRWNVNVCKLGNRL